MVIEQKVISAHPSLVTNKEKMYWLVYIYKGKNIMKPSERAKQLNTTVTKMSKAWRCSTANLRELYRNAPHKFDLIARGTYALEVEEFTAHL